MKTKRLEVLQASLVKKTARVDRTFDTHFADVKSANGQPLNDKRNGAATTARWDKQSNTIRNAQKEVKRTENAIEREQGKISEVAYANGKLPQWVLDMVASGDLAQWRRNPDTFFVPGVDKGRIKFDLVTGSFNVRYLSDVSKEQYPKFRNVVNKMLATQRRLRPDLFS